MNSTSTESKSAVSRRQFLQTGSSALAGAALLGALPIERSAHAAGSELLKIALVGCGGRGSGAADQALRTAGNTKLVAMADVLPEKISGRKDKMGFVTPEQIWVTRDRPERFRSLAHAAIDAAGNLFTPAARHRVDDIVGGRRRYHSSLWRIISFGAWVDRFNVAVN